jgi:hypothetical protein
LIKGSTEFQELVEAGLLPGDHVPPIPLGSVEADEPNFVDGSLIFDCESTDLRLGERRLALLDGNHRMNIVEAAIGRKESGFLKDIGIHANLSIIDCDNALAVQFTGMRLNNDVNFFFEESQSTSPSPPFTGPNFGNFTGPNCGNFRRRLP